MRIVPDWRHLLALATASVAASWAISAPSLAAMTGTVTLTPASVHASGIAVVPLTPATQTAQVQGVATVLDPQPLLALAARLQRTHAAALAAEAAAEAADAQAKRSQALYRQDENTSLRDLQAAEAAAAAARAQRMTARADETAARSGARSQWGPVLARLAARGPQALRDYADGHAGLLEVVLPNGTRAPTGDSIRIGSPDGQPSTATLLGASPRADAIVQGPTFFYRTTAAGLRSGQRLSATVPLDSAVRRGVDVPAAAVIWYAGQPWAYVETAAGQFQRRPLDQVRDAQGWFQARGFHAGEKVVVRGGELLLSQEMQPPPGAAQPAWDDDDD
ncbi:MAG: hypothetical protein KGJ63_03630 [Pseudomonadota bacterium]|nr:hypothetical protein [Pseudomonadota bacterium]